MPGGPMPSTSGAPTAENPNKAGAEPEVKKRKGQSSLYASRVEPFAPLPPPGDRAELERRLKAAEAKAREQAELAQLASLPAMSIFRPPTPAGSIATGGTGTDPNAAAAEIPVQRRVAGLMWGDRVAAVLETDGKGDVVRPGDVITTGGKRARVARIDRDAVILRTDDKKTIRVPITASALGATPAGGPGPGGPGSGYPGMPYPGMPGPGGPPRMPRGPQPMLPEG
jgi:hypothetical protein